MRKREMQAAVKRGIKLLDSEVPDWRSKIDLEELDLFWPCHCVLGQATEGYYTAIGKLDIDPNDYGFSIPVVLDDRYNSRNYANLTQLWKEALS